MKFNESVYYVDENNGPAQLVLVFDIPSSTDIIVEVLSADKTASGIN